MTGNGGGGTSWRAEPKTPVKEQKPNGGDGPGGGEEDPCVLQEQAFINSVNASVLRNVRVGDVLDVQFLAGPPRLLVNDRNANALGSITSQSYLQIIACIQNGRQYVAEVLSINGGACYVNVRLK
ncbi:hypothetical protein SG18_12675 [Pandoraea apista]|nr:hypothetical protein SG18_12675 [Pandoraea apista]AKH72908.1 hypothetical protein XM39_12875 [Pandoraea apista]AKI61293.1 hypothetical protein AA956_05130 [Pandoraea apista]